MKNKHILIFGFTLCCSLSLRSQTFQKEYYTGTSPNFENTKGYDCAPSTVSSGYTAFTMLNGDNHLIRVDANGNLISALKSNFNGQTFLAEGGSFVQLSNGNYVLVGIINNIMQISEIDQNGSPVNHKAYDQSSSNTGEVVQILQVEKYDDYHIYVRGISQEYGGNELFQKFEHHFLCMLKRNSLGNSFSIQWTKELDWGWGAGAFVPIYSSIMASPLHDDYTRYGDMHVSLSTGDVYYTGRTLSDGANQSYWVLRKFNLLTGNEMGSKEVYANGSTWEPTGVVENTEGTEVYVCGFDEEDAFITKFNLITSGANTGHISSTWITRRYSAASDGLDYLRFHSIEYRPIGSNSTKLKVVGEAKKNTTFAIAINLRQTNLQPVGTRAYYDFVRLEEIAPNGQDIFVMTGLSINHPGGSYNLGLLRSDGNLYTSCSETRKGPTYYAFEDYAQNSPALPGNNFTVVLGPFGGAENTDYQENTACCQLEYANEVVTLCDGSGVQLTPGNFFAYYLWSDGSDRHYLDVVSPGLYSVVVIDENGCWAKIHYTVNLAPPINLTPTITAISCYNANDGDICFSASVNIANASITPPGGSPTMYPVNSNNFCLSTYVTQGGNPGLHPGMYSVIVYDQYGCSENYAYNLQQPDPIGIIITNQTCADPGQCNGSLQLNITGTSNFVINVTSISSQNTYSHGTYVNPSLPFNVPPSSGNSGLCHDDPNYVGGGDPVLTYKIYVTDISSGCMETHTLQIDECGSAPNPETQVSVNQDVEPLEIKVYPNPASEILNVVLPSEGNYELSIFNVNGARVHQQAVSSDGTGIIQMDVSGLTPGMYLVVCTGIHGTRRVKILIE